MVLSFFSSIHSLLYFIRTDVNLIGRDGETPLHTAARYQTSPINRVDLTDLIQYLVTHQANLTKRDNQGRTALHYSAMRNHSHNAQQLIELGIPVDVKNTFGGKVFDIVR